jgi:peroxiredoxin
MRRKIYAIFVVLAAGGLLMGCGKGTPKQARAAHQAMSGSSQQDRTNVHNTGAMQGTPPSRSSEPAVQNPNAVLDFALKDQNGNEIRLSQYEGKIVVLEWFNPQCPFSGAHYKDGSIPALARKYTEKGIVWLAINSTNSATVESNKAFSNAYSIPYPMLDDHAGVVGRMFEAKTTPHLFILDANRQIVYQGAIDNAPLGKVEDGKPLIQYVDQALSELLKGVSISVAKTDSYGCSVKY